MEALRDDKFTGISGHCEQFVREVVESVFGGAFDRYLRQPDGSPEPTAYLAMQQWKKSPYVVWVWGDGKSPNIAAGDILYKGRLTSGAFGHVGIAFHNDIEHHSVLCVAENSSYHIDPAHEGNVSNAKGWRDISAFGDYELVVRLH